MLWEVEIFPLMGDGGRELTGLAATVGDSSAQVLARSRGYLLAGDSLDREALDTLLNELLVDPLAERVVVRSLPSSDDERSSPLSDLAPLGTVILKPGVTDPVAQTIAETAGLLGLSLSAVRTFQRYYGSASDEASILALGKRLANDAIEQFLLGPLGPAQLALGKSYQFSLIRVPLREADDAGLLQISRDGQLALNLDEMRQVQNHFRSLGRDPSDIELETVAQTWSEHCSHKTLKGAIDYREGDGEPRRIANLLKETIFGATVAIRQRLGANDWCVSVFEDNAGVVMFTEEFHACIKVETHNHPSAIEPYGGANTGLGGVIRDPLGTGLGAKPICNTDVFCFAPVGVSDLPTGVLPPRRIIEGVVAGVRDYGNRMGIPTVNGAVLFDERYLANPLVFCGTVGLIPVNRVHKQAAAGDVILAVGGRTGRDGIHGATFSSLELTDQTETLSGGAVQIGNAIVEKKLLDVLLVARDRGLYSAITDCGAGGFSSAIGEMASDLGAVVDLDLAPLKYEGLSYTEVWISEAQERMVLAVPQAKLAELQALCRSEDVETAVLGEFTDSGRLVLRWHGEVVGDLQLEFLHRGRPNVVRSAHWQAPPLVIPPALPATPETAKAALLDILSAPSVASKEWIIRQYDHEVQGGSVIKPLVGSQNDGPSDAAVVMPVFPTSRSRLWPGLAIGCGINPWYGDLDPAAMAECVIDEAVRNVVAVGADPSRVAILDNFCWGNVSDPAQLGALVRTAIACGEIAQAYGTPFVSGKDSLNNEYRSADRRISIPGTLLVTAMGLVPEVRRCVTMDLKSAGNRLYLIGETRLELGGSHLYRVRGLSGGQVPRVNREQAPRIFRALHTAIVLGCVRACHDLSEGGLAVAVAEMALAGGLGADVTSLPGEGDDMAKLFSESPTRFLVEVPSEQDEAFQATLASVPITKIGQVVREPRLRIVDSRGEWLIWASLAEIKKAWQTPIL